jgi:NAD(P)-dependent dehydrogenase (short-subunit alcohol dehydrogenase family)
MAQPGWSLEGRTVLITGAARGIGAESARHVAQRGANVSLVGLEPDELERVASECGEDRAAWFETDVTDWDALDAAVAGTVERFGAVDVVMANAGISPGGTVRSIEPESFERTIEVNLLGVWRSVRVCLPQVIERRGYVLTISSLAAMAYAPMMAPYTAAKAGVEAFSNALRLEVAHLGVDVGVGYLSWIATDMVAGADAHPAFGFARADLPGPFGRTYPVSKVGKAVADGIERRRRWVTVPSWLRAMLVLRGFLYPVLDAGGRRHAQEMDERFERDRAERGAEASAPVGAGGAAVRAHAMDRG